MKIALSLALILAAAGNLATNYTLNGPAQIAASATTGLIVIASATALIVLGRRRKRAQNTGLRSRRSPPVARGAG